MPAFNDEVYVIPEEAASMFVPCAETPIKNILCEQFERTVGNDNCGRLDGLTLQTSKTIFQEVLIYNRLCLPEYEKKSFQGN